MQVTVFEPAVVGCDKSALRHPFCGQRAVRCTEVGVAPCQDSASVLDGIDQQDREEHDMDMWNK